MTNNYSLNYAIHPGEYIEELLETYSMTQAELASRMHVSTKHLNQIIKGKANITSATALALEAVLDRQAGYWLSLQAKFDEFSARKEQTASLLAEKEWILSFDYLDLVKRGYVPQTKDLVEKGIHLLHFFQVASVAAWEDVWVVNVEGIYCRSAAHTDTDASRKTYAELAAWIRIGQLLVEQNVSAYPVFLGQKLSRTVPALRALTYITDPDEVICKVNEELKDAGVCLQYVEPMKGMRTYASSFMARSGQVACIQLSKRGKTSDQFFFSLFHEINHLLSRGTNRGFLIGSTKDKDEENAADSFAGDMLIPPDKYIDFLISPITRESILSFSQNIHIHSGIVVGRLQHENRIQYSQYNDLKINWK